jgi:UDP-N-acetylmuramate: L-alanyl-gamma-D-glutamyl-meso-diaminopimelate ligase
MIGEFNVRNAAMAVSAAHFYNVPFADIRHALKTFTGIRRRQEVRGEAGGVTVIDDFGHHPTAIAQMLEGLRVKFPQGKLLAVFEPRSNTTRRAVFQSVLPCAFDKADGVVLAKVARMDQLPENERLDPEKVVSDLRTAGKKAFYEPDTAAIVARVSEMAVAGDTVVVFSNGGFDNIHVKLLDRLGAKG